MEKGKCVNQTWLERREGEREHEKTIGSLSLLMMEAMEAGKFHFHTEEENERAVAPQNLR